MEYIDFKDYNKFQQLEKQAYNGTLEISVFPPAEYKYFNELIKLGYNYRHNGLSKEDVREKKQELYNWYRNETDTPDECFPLYIKKLILKQPTVVYDGGEYSLTACTIKKHWKEHKWYYSAELQEKGTRGVTIVDFEKLLNNNAATLVPLLKGDK